jgi:hypothetical protein
MQTETGVTPYANAMHAAPVVVASTNPIVRRFNYSITKGIAALLAKSAPLETIIADPAFKNAGLTWYDGENVQRCTELGVTEPLIVLAVCGEISGGGYWSNKVLLGSPCAYNVFRKNAQGRSECVYSGSAADFKTTPFAQAAHGEQRAPKWAKFLLAYVPSIGIITLHGNVLLNAFEQAVATAAGIKKASIFQTVGNLRFEIHASRLTNFDGKSFETLIGTQPTVMDFKTNTGDLFFTPVVVAHGVNPAAMGAFAEPREAVKAWLIAQASETPQNTPQNDNYETKDMPLQITQTARPREVTAVELAQYGERAVYLENKLYLRDDRYMAQIYELDGAEIIYLLVDANPSAPTHDDDLPF